MPDNKYNILLISRNFPPLTGGMERLLYHSYKSLSDEFNCTLIGPIGSSESTHSPHDTYECPFNIASFIPCSILKSYYATSKIKFDLIFAGSGINALPAKIISKIRNIPYITYSHGLDISYKNPIYQKLFLPAIRASELVIVNSTCTAELAKKNQVESKKVRILHPGVEIQTRYNPKYDLEKKLDIKKRKILLTAGRLVKRKGIPAFIKRCLPEIIRNYPDTLYLIAGEEPGKPSKHSIAKEIQQAINETSLHNHITILGKLNDDELISAYNHADLFIFPVIEDPVDIEGFGMVAIEAAANGTPTIAFSSGGIPDAVKNNISGILLPPNDYSAMSDAIIKYLRGGFSNITQQGCRNFAIQFSLENFKRQIITLCHEIIIDNDKG